MHNTEQVTEHLSLGNCIKGLNNLYKSLFGITLEYVDPEHGEVWDSDVHKLVSDIKRSYMRCLVQLIHTFMNLFQEKK